MIQSLIGFANNDKPYQAGPSRRQPTESARADGERTEAVRPRCTLLHDSNNGGKLAGSMSMTMIPWLHLIRVLAAINV
jgi:hypothetical protein